MYSKNAPSQPRKKITEADRIEARSFHANAVRHLGVSCDLARVHVVLGTLHPQ